MAENSYPFNTDNTSGGSSLVSETQWQQMASTWAPDMVDRQLVDSSIPFSAAVINGRSIQIQPGNAWVGGFYYKLTSAMSVTIEANSSSFARKDIVVIRADMTKSAVNIAVVKGIPASTPTPPQPRRQAGGLWEMVLYEAQAAAKNGAVTFTYRFPCRPPVAVTFPNSASASASFLPPGSFAYEAQYGTSNPQYEFYNGRDGYVTSRDLGKSRTYTPGLVNASTNGVTRIGRWRYIAPNTVYFSIYVQNTNNFDINRASVSAFCISFTLPVAANSGTGQIFVGHMDNDNATTNYPNFMSLTGKVNRDGSNMVNLFRPSSTSLAQGLDGLTVLPRKSHFIVTGVYEANQFKE
ncbi:hypothetical protein [Streptomyces sp. NPDC055036]